MKHIFYLTEEELRIRLVEALSCFYLRNDKAHRSEHFERVYKSALEIQEALGTAYHPNLFLVAAYVHDSFSWLSRKEHHNLSALYTENGDILREVGFLHEGEIELIAGACATHRASFKGEFPSKFAEIFNAADYEGMDPQAVYDRARVYANGDHRQATAHLWEKFAPGGYAIYPPAFLATYGDPAPAIRDFLVAKRKPIQ